jgi:replicative DNA helicase
MMSDGNGKQQANNLLAEQCVLGCLMLDYVGCSSGIDKLNKQDFHSPVHQIIFEAMTALLDKKNKTIDFVTVVDALKNAKKLDTVGGLTYLNQISDSVPSVANFRHYYDIVKKNSVLRRLNDAGQKIVNSSYTSDDEQETLSTAEKLIFDIAKQDERKDLTAIGDELPAVVKRYDLIRRDPTALYGLMTDFYAIDNMTNGFKGGELIILAARPGVGKTSLGLNMILNSAIKHGKKCAVFSLEMSKQSLVGRALCSIAGVSAYRANRGELDANEWAKITQANDTLSAHDIYIDDNSEITPTEIKRKCMRLKREHGLDFVMVDYLGLMNPGTAVNKNSNRQTEVAANSRSMKILAKELDVPVLLLAQLNRNVETRNAKGDDKKPALHDLRESGAIEQDADIVMFIHMPKPPEAADDDDDRTEPIEADIIIAKHRNGPCGVVQLAWERDFTRFRNTKTSQDAQDARDKAVAHRTKK